jgi:hypothetical protein
MRSVVSAHFGLCQSIGDESIFSMERIIQDETKELRYTRNSDFTDDVADEFLNRKYSIDSQSLANYPELLNPIFY